MFTNFEFTRKRGGVFCFVLVLFSSPEQKAQVSFSHQNLSVVVVVVLLTFSFSSSEPLDQLINKTWHKAFLGDRDSCFFE